MSEESSLNDRVAEEIRVLLVRRRSSASELARKAGMSQPYISRRLTGAATFDLDDLEKLATALDVEVAELLPEPAEHEGRSDQRTKRYSSTHPERPMAEQLMSAQIHAGGVHQPADPEPPRVPRPRSGTRRPAVRSWTHEGTTP